MAKSKSFENVSTQFISKPEPEEKEALEVPAGYELKPKPKTARINLLIRPEIKTLVKEKADMQGVSVNEYINRLIEAAINE